MKKLISIIIPNYNRADLIKETLDSITAQTYQDWECIIVDDGSTDQSIKTISQYAKKDSRFVLIERPESHPKGANACRNIGMQNCKGDYIIFFDSDDLMLDHHIEAKLKFITEKKLDFAIFKTMNFGEISEEEKYIDYSAYEQYAITADNYLQNKFRIFTLDLIISKKIIDQCTFYYKNQSALENVLMTQIVLLTENAAFKADIVSLRRCHSENITQNLLKNQQKKLEHIFFFYYNILDYLHRLHASDAAKTFVLDQFIYFYRQINFKLEVPFVEMIKKISQFGKPKYLLAIVTKRFKKI